VNIAVSPGGARVARAASQRASGGGGAHRGTHRYDPLLAALAQHAHFTGGQVAAGNVELRELGKPQARRIRELEKRAVAQRQRIVAGYRDEARRFLR
jgi:hypothetical protein